MKTEKIVAKINLILSIILVLISTDAFSNSLTLRYFQTDLRYNYRIELLRLAMDGTLESDGPYSLEPATVKATQKRGLLLLEDGKKVNVGFFALSKERESRFIPVRIPILRGILGYRVCLIRKDSLSAFSEIETLEQLKKQFKAGFGSQWADMEILRANNIPVVGTVKYDSLFKMLSGRRFDYFPRGINEAWNELSDEKTNYSDLTVAPRIALYYPYPVYYFVNKDHPEIANRIGCGSYGTK
ncbi:MAG: hypothetical protein JEZ12_27955 [Desulfobacterium sp.]|nr:hypothetical protein [Desulfobacterium sp.]